MSVPPIDAVVQKTPRRVSRLVIASLLFIGGAAWMMFASKEIELVAGWDRLGEALGKSLLYFGSVFSIAVAFLCWMTAAVKHGLKRIDVGASGALWVTA